MKSRIQSVTQPDLSPGNNVTSNTRKLAIALFLVYLCYVYLWYPGTMDWDSVSLANMAATGEYTTWFQPAFAFIWKLSGALAPNPGTLWLLQIALLFTGGYLVATSLIRLGWPKMAALVCTAGLLSPPFAYMYHEMTKDTLMGATLTCLFGVAARLLTQTNNSELSARRVALSLNRIALPVIVALAVLALATRQNAIFAVLPVYLLAIYVIAKQKMARTIRITIVSLGLIGIGMTLFTQSILRPVSRPVITALIRFDLAGITFRSGEAVSSLVADAVMVDEIRRCYTRRGWDSLVQNDCAKKYSTQIWESYRKDSVHVLTEWLGAITQRPTAYIAHRLDNFLSILRIHCDACDDKGLPLAYAQNPSNAPVRISTLAVSYEAVASYFFSWVRPWTVGLLAVLMVSYSGFIVAAGCYGRTPALLVLCGSASAVLYMAPNLVIGVASDFRYSYWLYNGVFLSGLFLPSMVLASRIEIAGDP